MLPERAERRQAPLATAATVSAQLLLVAAAIFVSLLLLSRLRLAVLPIVGALFICTFLAPPARWLRERGWPPAAAAWFCLLSAVAVLAGVLTFVTTQVLDELDDLRDDVEEGIEQVREWLVDGPLDLDEEQLERWWSQAQDQVEDNQETIASGALSGAVLAFEVLAGLAMMFVLIFFFIKDGPRMVDWMLERLSPDRRELVRAAGGRGWWALGGFLRGQAIVAMIDAVGIGIGLAIIGVPLALPLAVITFFGAFLPIVGAVLAGALAVLVALASGGITDALWVLGIVVAVQQVESNVLEPVVMSRAVKLHPTVIIVALTAGAVTAGLIGAFLAVPITAVATVVTGEVRRHRAAELTAEPASPPAPS